MQPKTLPKPKQSRMLSISVLLFMLVLFFISRCTNSCFYSYLSKKSERKRKKLSILYKKKKKKLTLYINLSIIIYTYNYVISNVLLTDTISFTYCQTAANVHHHMPCLKYETQHNTPRSKETCEDTDSLCLCSVLFVNRQASVHKCLMIPEGSYSNKRI